jgi:glycosyltransferase involved in cell wall biosynthesis
MELFRKYNGLSIAVFGRGGGVEHADGIRFQRLDFRLNTQLASLFSQVVLVPLVYRYGSPLWENFSGIYKERLERGNIKVLPAYNYSSFNGTNKFTIRIRAWIRWGALLFKALRCSDLALIYFPSTLGLMGAGLGFFMRKPIIAYIGADWAVNNPRTGKVTEPRGLEKLFFEAKSVVGNFLTMRFRAILMRDYGFFKRWSKRRSGVFYVPGNTAVSKNDVYERIDTCLGEPIVCLVVASLIPRKGIDDIIRAIGMLIQEGYPLKLWHAGASVPENLAKMVTLCSQLGVDEHVIFHGYKNYLDELLSLYRQADIFVLASHSEGYPRVVTEAQSQGLPVIATSVGGIPSRLQNGRHAILVSPGKPVEIARAIETIIHDGPMRRKMIADNFRMAQEELSGNSAIEVIGDVIAECFPEVGQAFEIEQQG